MKRLLVPLFAMILGCAFPAAAQEPGTISFAPGPFSFPGQQVVSYDETPFAEDAGAIILHVLRAPDLTGTVTVSYQTTTQGTAQPGSDYTPVSGVLTFGPDEFDKTISIPLLNDSEAEADEVVVVILGNPSAGSLGAHTAVATITSEDPPLNDSFAAAQVITGPRGVVTGLLSGATLEPQESDTPNGFTIDRSVWYRWTAPSSETVTFSADGVLSIFTGTTLANVEEVVSGGYAVSFDATAGTQYRVRVADESGLYGNGRFDLAWLIPNPKGSFRLLANGGIPGGDVTIEEDPGFFGSALYEVERVGGSEGTVSVRFSTGAGTATPGSDYTAVSTVLTFGPGETLKSVIVPLLQDKDLEEQESIPVALSEPTGGADLYFPATGTITIISDDQAGTIGFQNPGGYYVDEYGVYAIIGLTRDGSAGTVTVNYRTVADTATAGTDFTSRMGTVTFQPGQTFRSIAIPIIDDDLIESEESFTVELSNPTGGAMLAVENTQSIIITSDDIEDVVTVRGPSVVTERDGTAMFEIVREGRAFGTVTVDFQTQGGDAEAGTDFTAAQGTITFQPGQRSQAVTVTVLNDSEPEGYETFSLVLSNPTEGAQLGSDSAGVFIESDDESAGTFVVDHVEVSEAAGTAVLHVQRKFGSVGTVSVSFSTVPDSADIDDFTPTSGTINFGPGEFASKPITIPITNDSLIEAAESFLINFSDPTGGASLDTLNAFVTIINDDRPSNDLLVNATSVSGLSGTITGSILGATSEGKFEEDPNLGIERPLVWYRWVAPATGTVEFVLPSPGPDIEPGFAAVFRGSTYANLRQLTAFQSRVTTPVSAGTTYYIGVGGDSAQPDFQLDWRLSTVGAIELADTRSFFDPDSSIVYGVYVANEEDGGFSTRIRRTGVPNGTVSVTLEVNSDPDGASATEGMDFTGGHTVVTFGPGEVEKVVTIPVIADSEEEPTETFAIRLTTPTGGAILGGRSAATIFIYDGTMDPVNDDFDSATPIFGASGQRNGTTGEADLEQAEPENPHGEGHTIWYRWAPQKSGPATINAVVGSDFESDPAPVIEIFVQENGGLQPLADNVTLSDDGTGFVTREYASEIRTAVTAGEIYYIRIDDPLALPFNEIRLRWAIALPPLTPQISFASSSFQGREGFNARVEVKVQRTGPLDDFSAVDLFTVPDAVFGAIADPDVDYVDVATTLIFAPGETLKTIFIPLLDDQDLEGDEFLQVVLGNASGADLPAGPDADSAEISAIVTIRDDDGMGDFLQNDNFSDRIVLSDEAGLILGTTEGASLEPGEPEHGAASVWYEWTAPALSGVATFTEPSGLNRIRIYTGDSLSALNLVTEGFSSVAFLPVAGTTYFIALTGYEDEFGTVYTSSFELTYILNPSGSLILVDLDSLSASEASGAIQISLTRVGSTTGTSTLKFASSVNDLNGGLFATEDDFAELAQTVTFLPGQTNVIVNIPVVNDTLGEGDESFQVAFSDPSRGSFIDGAFEDGTGSVTRVDFAVIVDDDDDPAAPDNDAFAAGKVLTGDFGEIPGTNLGATREAGEPEDTELRTVWYRWTAPASGPVIFTVEPDDFRSLTFWTGTAPANLAEVPFVSFDGFVALAGTTYHIAVGTFDEDPDEDEGDFTLEYHLLTGGVLSLREGPILVEETEGTAMLTVERTGTTTGTVSVRVVSTNDTAMAGADYQAVDTLLTFGPGETTKTLNISILNDAAREGTESFIVNLAETTGDVILDNTDVVVRIDDDDDDPRNDDFADSLALSGPFGTTNITNLGSGAQPIEPAFGGSHTVWHRWTAPADGTVIFRADGDGFDPILGVYRGPTLTGLSEVPATRTLGDEFCTIEFTTTAGAEYHIVMDGVGVETGDAILSWSMKIPGRLQFSTPLSVTISESGGSVMLTVNRTGGSDGMVGVHYKATSGTAAAGTDFTATEGDLVFAAGETSKTISIPIINNAAFEMTESFSVVLSTPTGGASLGDDDTAAIQIINDDAFAPRAARYAALVNPGGIHAQSGVLTLSVSATGSFTGQLSLGGLIYKMKGTVDALGAANVPLLRKGRTPLAISLQVTDGGSAVSGEVYDETFRVPFAGESSFYDGKNRIAPQAGTYNVAFQPLSTDTDIPQGFGVASWKVSPAGIVTLKAGLLADNTPLNASGFIAESGRLVVYSTLYKGTGSFAGEVVFRDQPGTDADGDLRWFKPGAGTALPSRKLYTAGFTAEVGCLASRYAPPSPGQRLLPGLEDSAGAAKLTLTSGDLTGPITAAVTVGLNHKVLVTLPNPNAVVITTTPKKAQFKGTFQPTGASKTQFRGVFLPKSDRGVGLFFGTDQSGSVEFTPDP